MLNAMLSRVSKGLDVMASKIRHKYFCADFETNTTPESILENPVWIWACAPIGATREEHVATGSDIESFLRYTTHFAASDTECDDYTVFFHNLKFDGNFIIPQLMLEGFRYVDQIPNRAAERETKTFSALRSANGAFYTVTVVVSPWKTLTFRDSLKIITGSIKSMPKLFGFDKEIGKLPFSEDDYTRIRPKGYEPTEREVRYCKYDVLVLCRALQELHKAGFDFDCLTTGGFAWQSVCENLCDDGGSDEKSAKAKRSRFKSSVFSIPEDEWLFAREAYYGGITVCNPFYQGKELHEVGRTDDVNSMYPTVMRYYNLPYGKGKYVAGDPRGIEYTTDKGRKPKLNNGTLWIARIRCHMVVKPLAIPIFTPKCYDTENEFSRLWKQGERVVNTYDRSKEPIEIVITSVDWDNLCLHYDFQEVEWIEAYLYKSRNDLFRTHVDKYTAMKVESKKQGLKGQTYVAKLCLNSAYGKLGQRNYIDNLIPYMDEEGRVKWQNELDLSASIYKQGRPMHIAAFITAWARWILCEHIRAVGYHRFCYADTDSVHYLGTEAPEGTKIDSTKLGYWDNESIWTDAKFVRPKAYYEVFDDGEVNIKLAGCPASLLYEVDEDGNLDKHKPKVSLQDFDIGMTLHGKKRPVITARGVYLENVDYTFKEAMGWGER